MATQLLIARSAQFTGAASIAGGAVGCALGDEHRATGLCLKTPSDIDVSVLVDQTQRLAAADQIDPLSNLARARALIIQGTEDKVVNPGSAPKLRDYLKTWISETQLESVTDLHSAHTFPTVDQGNACVAESLPWIGKCAYDAAQKILSSLVGSLKDASAAVDGSLVEFDQAEFADGDLAGAQMGASGWAYIPTSCRTTAGCAVHVALHGCLQGPLYVADQFRTKTGYNRWAEANRIIVVYPTAVSGPGNPLACWDWWGYSGANYLTKDARQIKAMSRMVERLSS